ncbi:phage tail tube protein [Clostridium sp. BJN0001]|uniref:phage tail tube protein n=1 Tax=Clostridium sp. BJN0001 TaxID=2930219 RepID=UPI001FD5763B|nr:phage tail tube protein [Clostridium sp. BJN0001]
MSVAVNRILKGSNGVTWIDGEQLSTLKDIEVKIKGEFSDDNFCGDPATYSTYNGWSGEGKLTQAKIDSKLWAKLCEAYKTGVMPDIKIISALTDKATGKSERVAVTGVVFTEFSLIKYKAKEAVDEEFSFKFNDYDVLDKID